MAIILNDRFNIEFRNENDIEYLIIGVDLNEKVNNYQIEIIGYNENMNFMPVNVVEQDEAVYFCYEIESKISLTQVIENTQLSKDEVLKIIIEITKFIISCYRFLLTDTSLLLDSDYIYLDMTSGDVYMIYIPIDCGGDITKQLTNIVKDIFTKVKNNPENTEIGYFETILKMIEPNIDDIKEFYRKLKDIYNSNSIDSNGIKLIPQGLSSNNSTDGIDKKNEAIENSNNQNSIFTGIENLIGEGQDKNDNEINKVQKVNYEDHYLNNELEEKPNELLDKNLNENLKKDFSDIKDSNFYMRRDETSNYEDEALSKENYQNNGFNEAPEVDNMNNNKLEHNYLNDTVYENNNISSQKKGVSRIFLAFLFQLIIVVVVGGIIVTGVFSEFGESKTTYAFIIATAVVVSAIMWDKVLDNRLLKKRKEQDSDDGKKGSNSYDNEYLDDEDNFDNNGYLDEVNQRSNQNNRDYNQNNPPQSDYKGQQPLHNNPSPPYNSPPAPYNNPSPPYNNPPPPYNEPPPPYNEPPQYNKQQPQHSNPYNQNNANDYNNPYSQNTDYEQYDEGSYGETQGLDINQINNIKNVKKPNNFNKPPVVNNVDEDPNDLDENEETVVMFDEEDSKYPILVDLSGKTGKDIVINKNKFVVGRMKKQTDFACHNNSVGRLHAEIISKRGEYYVKDLESRNGTYLNGKRIKGKKEYIISNNDRISFANSHFKFVRK
ncbi:MAG: DUF6382 domain-containing protein [Clostridiales bacterium]